jgi:hypothetical protein
MITPISITILNTLWAKLGNTHPDALGYYVAIIPSDVPALPSPSRDHRVEVFGEDAGGALDPQRYP